MTATTITSHFFIQKEQRNHAVIDFLRKINYRKVSQLCLPWSQGKITDKWSATCFLDDLEENNIQGLDIWDTSNAETIAWVKNVIDFAITTGKRNDYFDFYASRELAMSYVKLVNIECRENGFPTDDYFINEHICPSLATMPRVRVSN